MTKEISDELLDTLRESHDVRSLEPGVLHVDHAEVRWSCVSRGAYDEAWARALARFR
jgi:hypothetical protein